MSGCEQAVDGRVPANAGNGFLAGLVAITCPCYWVDPVGAFFIGIVAGLVVIWGLDFLEYLRIDDPIGAVPVHLAAGIWGTLSLGFFATGAYGASTATGPDTTSVVTGLFYGGGLAQLGLQALGSMSTCVATLVVSLLMMAVLKRAGILRVSRAGEIEGLDLHEHGASAYPEYALATGATHNVQNGKHIGLALPTSAQEIGDVVTADE